jgi:UDP-N-acetyl-D-mannosaminuronate dehydrogenase
MLAGIHLQFVSILDFSSAKRSRIVISGLGHGGLKMSVHLARCGFKVEGVETFEQPRQLLASLD